MKTAFPVSARASAFGIAYRASTTADEGFVHAVYASTRKDEVATTGWSKQEQADFLLMQSRAQDDHYKAHYPDARWLIVVRDGVDIGRLYIEDWTSELRIIDIALLPEHRGSGVGEAILKDLQDRTAATGRSVSIHVEKQNPAMSLYRRIGFQCVEDKGVYDLMAWRA